ncbi:MAG TPA: hypothetical protein PLO65_16745 [Caulobacter sp.]|nr:hypothetical protein [Caulobacter sp.]
MTRFGRLFTLAGAVLAVSIASYAAPASAQATRTWVSGVGDDANPCSRTAPCKTFAGAISKTAAGGEIDTLDPGGFGSVTITKSITLDGSGGSTAGVLVGGTNGFVINDGGAGTVVVTIRNMDLEGIGFSSGSAGIRGIWFVSGASLTVENSTIRNFRDPTNGTGIMFTPSGAGELYVNNVTLSGNGNGTSGGGILIKPTGTGSARAVLSNVRARDNNTGFGLKLDTTGNTGTGINAMVTSSDFSGGGIGVAVVTPPSTTSATLMLTNSTVSQNTNFGIISNGATATVRVGNTVVTGNGTGLLAGGTGVLSTYGDNMVDGNTTNGVFSPSTAITKK